MNICFKKTRQLFFTIFMLMDYFNYQPANAQFVRVMLEIPSKSRIRVFNTGINKGRGWYSRDINHRGKKLLQGRNDKSFNWIEITTTVNMQIGVEIISDETAGIPDAAYLNGGIPDVSNAVPFKNTRADFPMNNVKMFSENKKKGFEYFKAWILLRPDKIRQIIFEYN